MAVHLGIDYGLKRIGLAISDTLEICANPLSTVENQNIFQTLTDLIPQHNITVIVVGMPYNPNGQTNTVTPHILGFIRKLKKLYPNIEILSHDERYTSKLAQQAIISSGMKKSKRQNKAEIDKISAAILLNDYLHYRKHTTFIS